MSIMGLNSTNRIKLKAAFLDRDGTIVQEYPDAEWANVWEPIFLDGAIEGLKALQEREYKLFVITNQPLINEGIVSQTQYDSFTSRMLEVLHDNDISISGIKYCPHARWEGCRCLKPKTGMVDDICAEHEGIDLAQSFLAGDSNSDMELAQTLGIRSFKIDPDARTTDQFVVRSLREIPALL